MALPESFLCKGIPQWSYEAFSTNACDRMDVWRLVLLYPRQWHLDVRTNDLAAPLVVFIFGVDGSETSSQPLLAVESYHNCREALSEKVVKDIVKLVNVTSKGVLPGKIEVVAVLDTTHIALNLFSVDEWQYMCGCLVEYLSIPVSHACLVQGVLEAGDMTMPSSEWSDLVTSASRAFLWASKYEECPRQADFADASIPCGCPTAELLQAVLSCDPLLYAGMFTAHQVPLEDHDEVSSAKDPQNGADTETRVSRLQQSRDAAYERLRQVVGECTTFSLSASGESHPPAKGDVYGLLFQRPWFVKGALDDQESFDPGPLSPFPYSPEWHLFRDRGEPCYLQERVEELTAALDFCLDDYFHDDGGLLVQLTPVEGVPFSILEAILPFIQQHAAHFSSALSPRSSPPFASCLPFPYPRVVRRQPSGTSTKLNPMTKARAKLSLTAAGSEELHLAALLLQMLSKHVVALDSQKSLRVPLYSLSSLPTVEPVSDTRRQCCWCSRRMEKLLRCSRCKMAWYCGPAHQIQDWKEGAHRTECAWWLEASRRFQMELLPKLQDGSDGSLEASTSLSCRRSLVSFLLSLNLPGNPLFTDGAGAAVSGASSGGATRVLYCHIISDEALDMNVLLQSFADELSWDHDVQLRFIVFSEGFSERQRNEVWAAGSHPFLLPPSGVIGDAWRLQSPDARNQKFPALFRICNSKFHLFSFDSATEGSIPNAIISFGPVSGSGLNYFSAALEVFADRFCGRVPSRWAESSYIGSRRTLSVLQKRLAGRCTHDTVPLSKCPPFTIELNTRGLCAALSTSVGMDSADGVVPAVCNAYYFDA